MQLVVFEFMPHEAGSTCGDEDEGRRRRRRGDDEGSYTEIKILPGIMS